MLTASKRERRLLSTIQDQSFEHVEESQDGDSSCAECCSGVLEQGGITHPVCVVMTSVIAIQTEHMEFISHSFHIPANQDPRKKMSVLSRLGFPICTQAVSVSASVLPEELPVAIW